MVRDKQGFSHRFVDVLDKRLLMKKEKGIKEIILIKVNKEKANENNSNEKE